MLRRTTIAAAVIVAVVIPRSALAWGFVGHRYIMTRAIDLLPAPLQPFFQKYREEIVIRAIDPDLWRNVGWEDDPHHFVNFGVREFGEYPFRALPHEYGAALQKFGLATLKREGMLPWRVDEMFGNMRRTFEAFAHGAVYGPSDLVLFSASAAHYSQDAHQPLHATNNYDGQLTGNHGVHARFERDLIERYQSRLNVRPAAPKAITNAREFAFDALLASHNLVDAILKADTDATAGKDTYDDEYFEKFFEKVKPILEQRLGDSITATAGLIIGAWEAAGKPTVALEGARPVEKVRKPGIKQ